VIGSQRKADSSTLSISAITYAFGGQERSVTDRNFNLKVGLASHEAGEKVSGTDVNLNFVTSTFTVPGYSDPNYWHAAEVIEFKVTCNQIVNQPLNYVWVPSGMPPSTGPTVGIRIASTEFQYNATINFSVSAKFALSRPGESKIVTVTGGQTLTAYNRLTIWASKIKESDDEVPQFPWPDENQPFEYSQQAYEIADYTILKFGGSTGTGTGGLHYYVTPQAATTSNATRTNILARAKVNTAIWSATHGDGGGIYDGNNSLPPYETQTNADAGYIADANMNSAIWIDRVEPRVCIFGLYACEGSTNMVAREILNGSDRNIGGFDFPGILAAVVRIAADPDNGAPSSDFNKEVLNNLEAGQTLEQSLNNAYTLLRTLDKRSNGTFVDMPPELFGDPLTRIRYVYLTQAERDMLTAQNRSGEIDQWYFIY